MKYFEKKSSTNWNWFAVTRIVQRIQLNARKLIWNPPGKNQTLTCISFKHHAWTICKQKRCTWSGLRERGLKISLGLGSRERPELLMFVRSFQSDVEMASGQLLKCCSNSSGTDPCIVGEQWYWLMCATLPYVTTTTVPSRLTSMNMLGLTKPAGNEAAPLPVHQFSRIYTQQFSQNDCDDPLAVNAARTSLSIEQWGSRNRRCSHCIASIRQRIKIRTFFSEIQKQMKWKVSAWLHTLSTVLTIHLFHCQHSTKTLLEIMHTRSWGSFITQHPSTTHTWAAHLLDAKKSMKKSMKHWYPLKPAASKMCVKLAFPSLSHLDLCTCYWMLPRFSAVAEHDVLSVQRFQHAAMVRSSEYYLNTTWCTDMNDSTENAICQQLKITVNNFISAMNTKLGIV